jgi:hypothetical protein
MRLKAHTYPIRILVVAMVIAASGGSAYATYVLDPPGATTTLSDTTTGQVATYEFATYSTAGTNRQLRQFVYSFPSGTDLSGAALVSHAGTVSYSGTTLTVTFDPRIPNGTAAFAIVISGVVNGAAGTYTGQTAQIRNHQPRRPNSETATLAIGDYAIRTAPYLSLTITTPADGQRMVFGAVDPDVTSPAQQVVVAVESSKPFIINRTLGGDAELMGLTVEGVPADPQAAGTGSFVDSYTITPPWTSEPEVELSATVSYTVVQQ